ncbi:MAG: serine hydrolase domain-containing protein [Pseudomonadota bacterium]
MCLVKEGNITLFCIFCIFCFGTEPSNAKAFTHDLLVQLHNVNQVPGMPLAVVKNQKLIWSDQVGYADLKALKAVNENTKFRLASVSKFVTTAMIARLVDQNNSI